MKDAIKLLPVSMQEVFSGNSTDANSAMNVSVHVGLPDLIKNDMYVINYV